MVNIKLLPSCCYETVARVTHQFHLPHTELGTTQGLPRLPPVGAELDCHLCRLYRREHLLQDGQHLGWRLESSSSPSSSSPSSLPLSSSSPTPHHHRQHHHHHRQHHYRHHHHQLHHHHHHQQQYITIISTTDTFIIRIQALKHTILLNGPVYDFTVRQRLLFHRQQSGKEMHAFMLHDR